VANLEVGGQFRGAETGPDESRLVVPAGVFNDAVNGGDAVIDLVASIEVDPEGCDLPAFITVAVELFVPSALDADGNGVPDQCACPGDTNGDETVDIDDIVNVVLDFGTDGLANGGDVDGRGGVDIDEVVLVVLNFGPC
jgi:hypothetical protein